MKKNKAFNLILASAMSLASLSAFAGNKTFLNCHTSDGSDVSVTLINKSEALVAEISQGAEGTHAIQRSGLIQGATTLGDAEIQVSDASGVILSVGGSGANNLFTGFYVHSNGKSTGISCPIPQ